MNRINRTAVIFHNQTPDDYGFPKEFYLYTLEIRETGAAKPKYMGLLEPLTETNPYPNDDPSFTVSGATVEEVERNLVASLTGHRRLKSLRYHVCRRGASET